MTHFDLNEMSRRMAGMAEKFNGTMKKDDYAYREEMLRQAINAAKHDSMFRNIWKNPWNINKDIFDEQPKNPAEEAYIRQSKIKRDPNNITHLCTVRVIN
jgi:hypothetical protein